MNLAGRAILVTGASSGIGRAVARSYLDEGAEVWAVARNSSRLAAAVDGHPAAHPVAIDLTRPEGRRAVREAVGGRALDVVVHAAGILGPRVPLAVYPEEDWRTVFEINVTAVHLLHQQLVDSMSPAATIIGVSSTVGRAGRGTWGMYSISKGALENWMEVLADEWSGRVYSVNPGGTATPMRARAMPDEDPSTIPSPETIVPVFLRLAHPHSPEPPGAKLNARDWIGRDPWEGLDGQKDPR